MAITKFQGADIRVMLVMNTGHLNPVLREDMECWNWSANVVGGEHPPTAGGAWSYGWLIYCGNADHWPTEHQGTMLHACAEYAKEKGFQYILFDQDGPRIEGLDYFDED